MQPFGTAQRPHSFTDEPSYWYFELVEAIRKILLISLLPAITQEGTTSFLWGSFVLSFAALLLTFSLRPCTLPSPFSHNSCVQHVSSAIVCADVEPSCDRLQLYTLTATCMTFFYGICLDNEKVETANPREASIEVLWPTSCPTSCLT